MYLARVSIGLFLSIKVAPLTWAELNQSGPASHSQGLEQCLARGRYPGMFAE